MSKVSSPPSPWQSALGRLTDFLAGLSTRERLAVLAAFWLLVIAVAWWVALAPAWRTLSQAPQRHARLDDQLGEMRRLAATAEALRGQGSTQVIGHAAALRAIEVSMATLGGTAKMNVIGDRVNVTLTNTPPQALAQWLAQVRLNARVVPVEAQLNAGAQGGAWSGTVLLGGTGLAEN